MLNPLNILQGDEVKNLIWRKRLAQGGRSRGFLYLFAPMLESIFQKLCQVRNALMLPTTQALVSDEFLINCIVDDFVENIHPAILRIAVLEMRLLRQEHLLEGDTAEQRFDYFIEVLAVPENAIDFLNKYPLFHLQVIHYTQQFVAMFSEFLQRLYADYDLLVQFVFDTVQPTHLKSIKITGDRHHQGRAVMVLELQQAQETDCVVYKPRCLAMDVAFQQLVEWHNQVAAVALKKLRILPRVDYGWCEFLDYKPCQTIAEIKAFYYRAGALLMLIHLLHGCDIHVENIIAQAEFPTIVDYECLLYPQLQRQGSEGVRSFPHLVSETSFLPERIRKTRKHKGSDVSVIGADYEEESYSSTLYWLNSGLDTMYAKKKYFNLNNPGHKPRLQSKPVDFLDYETYFLQGFSETHALLCKQRDFLLSANSVLNSFQSTKTRLILHTTYFYTFLLTQSHHPRLQYSFHQRNKYWRQQFQIQPAFFFMNHNAFSAEIYDLRRGNVPVFSVDNEKKILLDSRNRVMDIDIIKSGYELMLDYVRYSLNAKDLAIQLSLIHNSFVATRLNKNQINQVGSRTLPSNKHRLTGFQQAGAPKSHNLKGDGYIRNATSMPPLNSVDFRRWLGAILERELDWLIDHAIVDNGKIVWPIIEFAPSELWQFAFTKSDLYNGMPGIILTFAYAGEVLSITRYTDWARQCFNSLMFMIKKQGLEGIDIVSFFAGGVSGLLYLLTTLYCLWQDESIVPLITPLLKRLSAIISKDRILDIFYGVAGCLLVLSKMQAIFPNLNLLPYSQRCVQHLLKMYPNPAVLIRGHKKDASQPLLGFSHGVSGILLALAQYYAAHQEPRVYDWIIAGLAYERQYFDISCKNWPDFRIYGDHNAIKYNKPGMVAWCHGAVGVGLARLAMQTYWQDALLAQEINIAVETTLANGFGEEDCLCHGNMGNLELLLYAALQMPNAAWINEYHQYLQTLLVKIANQEFQCTIFDNAAAIGLMTGRAGILYELLRILQPNRVPSILLLE